LQSEKANVLPLLSLFATGDKYSLAPTLRTLEQRYDLIELNSFGRRCDEWVVNVMAISVF
jgi:hypothetical protein